MYCSARRHQRPRTSGVYSLLSLPATARHYMRNRVAMIHRSINAPFVLGST